MSSEEGRIPSSDIGHVRIADDVVSTIAGLAAMEVEGVSAMSGGIAGGIAEVLGRRNLTKGVKVEVGAEEAKIDIFIVVRFGVRIPDVAWDIQENVKKSVEKMTGLRVLQVNIHVQGVSFPKDGADKEGEEDVSEKHLK